MTQIVEIIHVPADDETATISTQIEWVTESGVYLTTEGGDQLAFDGSGSKRVTVIHVPSSDADIVVGAPEETLSAVIYYDHTLLTADGDTLLAANGDTLLAEVKHTVSTEVIHV